MSYWSDRQDDLLEQLEKEEEKLKQRMSNFYRREARKLEGKISSYYSMYGEDNVIEYRKLMEKLNDEDVSLLIEAMDDFAEKYPEYAHLMPIRESIYKLNRLEGLQTSIKMQQLEIGAVENKELEEHLTKLSHRSVNAAAEALGFGKNFYSVNSDIVKMFVDSVHTNGKSFSQRIWGNTEKLTEYLSTDIAQAFARGDSYQNIIKHMKERFEKVSRNDMYRLIYTEGTYTLAHATMKPFEEDFEQYKISTAGDSKVCQTCRKVAEQVFYIKDKVSGTNFPPFHAWCRCSWEVYVEDWDKWLDDYVEKHGDKKQANKIKDRLETDLEDNFDGLNIMKFNNKTRRKLNDEETINNYLNKLKLKTNDKDVINVVKDSMRVMSTRDLDILDEYEVYLDITDGNNRYHRPGLLGIFKNDKKTIFINPAKQQSGSFAHEFAHFAADVNSIYDNKTFANILNDVLKSSNGYRTKKIGKADYIYVVSDKFVNEYQGRTYIKKENFKGVIEPNQLKEYISVGYQTYVTDPQLLEEIDKSLYDYFESRGLRK